MIGAADVRELARAQSLRDTVVEKDYVLGWLLWGLAAEPALGPSWAFKGGTCLSKVLLRGVSLLGGPRLYDHEPRLLLHD